MASGQVGEAVRNVSGGLFFGDVFSCAQIRFLECLKTFRPGSNNGWRAYLEKAINGAISDAQQEWQARALVASTPGCDGFCAVGGESKFAARKSSRGFFRNTRSRKSPKSKSPLSCSPMARAR